jgi:hypothetical protein
MEPSDNYAVAFHRLVAKIEALLRAFMAVRRSEATFARHSACRQRLSSRYDLFVDGNASKLPVTKIA